MFNTVDWKRGLKKHQPKIRLGLICLPENSLIVIHTLQLRMCVLVMQMKKKSLPYPFYSVSCSRKRIYELSIILSYKTCDIKTLALLVVLQRHTMYPNVEICGDIYLLLSLYFKFCLMLAGSIQSKKPCIMEWISNVMTKFNVQGR